MIKIPVDKEKISRNIQIDEYLEYVKRSGLNVSKYELTRMNYPTKETLIKLNKYAQSFTDESRTYDVHGLKEVGLVENLLYRTENSIVFGEDQFPTTSSKAAHFWYTLSRYQAFNNGNKRTGLLTVLYFLEANNLYLPLNCKCFLNLSEDIANEKVSENQLSEMVKGRICFKQIRHGIKQLKIGLNEENKLICKILNEPEIRKAIEMLAKE